MMSNRLSETNALAHTFAVTGHFAVSDLRHASAFEGFVCELRGLLVSKTVKAERAIDEVIAIRAGRERVELRAVADLPEKFDGLLGREAQDVNCALGWFDQAGQQVHQRSLARAVGADEAGNPRIEREVHFVHPENFPVKLGDIFENDLAGVWGHPRTVSRARKRALRMTSESKQMKIIALQAAGTGISFQPPGPSNPDCSRNAFAKISRTNKRKFRGRPQE